MTDSTTADWTQQFPGLAALPAEVRQALREGSRIVTVAAGTQIFGPGQKPDHLLMLLDGSVRVQQRSETGREVFLYRIKAGESCVMTTSCMMTMEEYSAEGIAETDCRAVAIPRKLFDDLLGEAPAFRQFVFNTYSRRIADLFKLVDDIVSRRVDVRLAARLLALAENGRVTATHQVLANELGSAREVISRILQDFHRRGWIEQARGEITLTAPAALDRLARS
ncbi:Crp/Fnr family transcriptional regulator [Frigidibacter sp. ROC022]|uniref:Crp/Fnr family transcriptional regulator n=1 Tax=Frigidibacter sp. ROC022 TaxID=2971796 RepID=UPI00215A253C|nr:Crp/Fnr family transcriptional regulator [Frigidibacter sp. ROC022]MCR8724340.1 Crp/Fnr family transcriptional regulator [Frigidibacter sp. ROC022]